MFDDAIQIRSVSFDTARYQLAPGNRAFGLRLEREGGSRPNPFVQETLRLYAIDGNRLVPVLDNIVVMQSRGEWGTVCRGEFQKTTRTLAMDSRAHQGAADIIATESVSGSVGKIRSDGQCEKHETRRDAAKIRLQYDRKEYVIPKDLKRLE